MRDLGAVRDEQSNPRAGPGLVKLCPVGSRGASGAGVGQRPAARRWHVSPRAAVTLFRSNEAGAECFGGPGAGSVDQRRAIRLESQQDQNAEQLIPNSKIRYRGVNLWGLNWLPTMANSVRFGGNPIVIRRQSDAPRGDEVRTDRVRSYAYLLLTTVTPSQSRGGGSSRHVRIDSS